MTGSLSFSCVAEPTTCRTGNLENDITVGAQPGPIPLASVWGSRVFCAPPIPRRMKGLAETILPREILDLGHKISDLEKILPHDDLKAKIEDSVKTIFEKKSPWARYIIYRLDPLKLSGMASFSLGFSPRDNSEIEGSYQASGSEIMLSVDIGLDDRPVFEEVVVVMLVVAKFFIDQRRKVEGRDVSRIVISFASEESIATFSKFQDLFLSRLEALKRVFGFPLGTLPARSIRNLESYEQEVWGVDVEKLSRLIDGYFGKKEGKE